MCDTFIPDYAYKEQHISCHNCSNTANMFMVDSFIDSNYYQAKQLSMMKINLFENEKNVDAKGNVQITQKIVDSYTPWFAENPSQIPLLVPICNSCKSLQVNEKQYIHCHHGFTIFKMQRQRFNSGSPYSPWVDVQSQQPSV